MDEAHDSTLIPGCQVSNSEEGNVYRPLTSGGNSQGTLAVPSLLGLGHDSGSADSIQCGMRETVRRRSLETRVARRARKARFRHEYHPHSIAN